GQRLHPGAGGERGTRLVEADVPCAPDAEHLDVDAPGLTDRSLVAVARGSDRPAVVPRHVDERRREAEGVDDFARDDRAVAFGMTRRQPDVLVECETAHP